MSEKINNFLKVVLPERVLQNNDEFRNYEVSNCVANRIETFDGFLSTLYNIELELKEKTTNE